MSESRFRQMDQVSLVTSEHDPDEGHYDSTTEASKCLTCGAYVWYENKHNDWHEWLDHTAQRANRLNGMETYG